MVPSDLLGNLNDLVVCHNYSIVQIVVLESPVEKLVRVAVVFFELLASEADRATKVNLKIALLAEYEKYIKN
jgi:hypothetical protein